jgi:hypothetical protein
MAHTFSKSAFYSFGDIPLAGPLPLIFSQLLRDFGDVLPTGSSALPIKSLLSDICLHLDRDQIPYRLSRFD